MLKSRRAALIIIMVTVLVTSLFASRLLADSNPNDQLPFPGVEKS